jgi:uncharacterized protein (TIGR02996 family)
VFAIVVHEPGRAPWRKAFAVRECRIGSVNDNDLVLDVKHRISAHHARLVLKDTKYILVATKTSSGVWVNQRKLKAPTVVKLTDTLTLGDVRIEIVPLAFETLGARTLVARDAKEGELLAAVDDADEARLVYADWLEGNGDHAHAELLRTQHAIDGEVDEAAIDARLARVRELAASIELPWRARLSKLPIDNCPQFRFKCPRQWSELTPTSADGERFCGSCQRTVYFCATIDEARSRGAKGECVAIDVASPRWKGDMDGPYGERVCSACAIDVGEGLESCPRCGVRLAYEMMELGEIA